MSFKCRGIYLAVVQRRDFSVLCIHRHLPRRCTTARFQPLLCTEAFTSPLYNGEISVPFIYRSIHFTVVQRRDFSHFYIQRHLPRRCTTARFQSLLYTEAFTLQRHLPRRCTTVRFQCPLYTEAFISPLYNGEILVSFIYIGHRHSLRRCTERRDFSHFYIQRHLPRRCTTARFQCPLYTEAFISPLYNGEISVSFIYRSIHFAVVQRRDFSVLYIPKHSFRR